MFANNAGSDWTGAGSIAGKIKRLSEDEAEALAEREGVLRDALNSFTARLGDLPERERRAALSLLYKEVAETVFDFHLSILAQCAREKIARAGTRDAKRDALREFRNTAEDLATLHGSSS
jgi:hypothetical protein